MVLFFLKKYTFEQLLVTLQNGFEHISGWGHRWAEALQNGFDFLPKTEENQQNGFDMF